MQKPNNIVFGRNYEYKILFWLCKALKYFILLETVKKTNRIIYIYKIHTGLYISIDFHLVKIMSKQYYSSYAKL